MHQMLRLQHLKVKGYMVLADYIAYCLRIIKES